MRQIRALAAALLSTTGPTKLTQHNVGTALAHPESWTAVLIYSDCQSRLGQRTLGYFMCLFPREGSSVYFLASTSHEGELPPTSWTTLDNSQSLHLLLPPNTLILAELVQEMHVGKGYHSASPPPPCSGITGLHIIDAAFWGGRDLRHHPYHQRRAFCTRWILAQSYPRFPPGPLPPSMVNQRAQGQYLGPHPPPAQPMCLRVKECIPLRHLCQRLQTPPQQSSHLPSVAVEGTGATPPLVKCSRRGQPESYFCPRSILFLPLTQKDPTEADGEEIKEEEDRRLWPTGPLTTHTKLPLSQQLTKEWPFVPSVSQHLFWQWDEVGSRGPHPEDRPERLSWVALRLFLFLKTWPSRAEMYPLLSEVITRYRQSLCMGPR